MYYKVAAGLYVRPACGSLAQAAVRKARAGNGRKAKPAYKLKGGLIRYSP